MKKYAVGIELQDITGGKWGQLEKGLNSLLKLAEINGRFEVNTQAHVEGNSPVVSFTLEHSKINFESLPDEVPDENGNVIKKTM